MKILIVSDMGSEAGGVEVMIVQLKQSLSALGHEVKILTGGEYPTDTKFNDYEFKSFTANSWRWRRYLLYIYNPFARRALNNVLREFQPDVVHLHSVSKASASILFSLKNIPTVMTAHDIECIDPTVFDKLTSLKEYKEQYTSYFVFKRNLTYYVQKLRFRMVRKGQKNIDIFIAPSSAMATILREANVEPRILTIHNGKGVPKPQRSVKFRKHPVSILFVGRLAPEKGVAVLIHAMQEVLEKMPEAKLTVIGDGSELEPLRSLVSRLHLGNSVRFVGAVAQGKISYYFGITDIVVVPSIYYEPLGVVAIEAMMCGKPVIASNSGGLAELVDHNKTGLVVDPGDVEQLSKRITELLSNPARIESMGRAGLKKAEAFSAARYIDQTVSVYKDVIAKYCS